MSVPNFDFLRPKLRIFGKSEHVRFDLFPRFLRPGAVFAKGISDQNHLEQYFRAKVFKIRVICVICGELVGSLVEPTFPLMRQKFSQVLERLFPIRLDRLARLSQNVTR